MIKISKNGLYIKTIENVSITDIEEVEKICKNILSEEKTKIIIPENKKHIIDSELLFQIRELGYDLSSF